MKSPPIRMGKTAAIIIVVFLLTNAAITAWALYARFSATNGHRAAQASLNARFALVTKLDCLEIEKLKTGFRIQAIANEKNLDRNAKLLGIKVTPALRRQEHIDTEKTLRTYARQTCPRPAKGAP